MKKLRKNKYILIFLLFIVTGLTVYWYWQKNIYSKDILRLEILGPETADFANDFDYIVKYKNNGQIRLEEAKLIFEYPKHSVQEDGKNQWQEIALDDIYPGEERTINFGAKLIGKEGEMFSAKATLSYRPKNLKPRYERVTTFTTQLKNLPLTFEFDAPSNVESGKDLGIKLNYFSNSDYSLLNLRIIAHYPSGFEFVKSVPNALEKTEWQLPPLNKAEGGRIQITGKMQGEAGEQKLFRAEIGMWKDGEFILLKEITRGLEITKPSIKITQQINGSQDYAASLGGSLHYEVFFKNLGEDTRTNLSLVDTLDGDIFDLNSITAPSGNFTKGDNSITWDWRRVDQLQFLDPQEEGKVEFWVNLKSEIEIPSVNGNIFVNNKVYLGQAKEEFQTKVNSKLELVQKGFFQDEIFGNSGPIPPEAGKATTYTISWQVKNYYNDVKNVKVKTILPSYVQLIGKIFPEDARFTFDSESREIVWEAGDLKAAQGVLNSAPNVSFQVSFTPSSQQKGQTPDIISQSMTLGEDSWTGDMIENFVSGINTTLPDDPSINGQGVVK